MHCFIRAPGVLLEPLDEGWAAFSSLSGESHLLNDESAAIVEGLDLVQPLSASAVCKSLAQDCGLPPAEVEQAIGTAWEQLIEAGLIREQSSASDPLQ